VLVTPALQVVHRVITRHLLDQTSCNAFEADSGAVTLIQRFGSAANLNIHLHCRVLDGVYWRTDGGPVFVQADSPTGEELRALLHKIIRRLMKLLARRGVLIEEEEEGGSSYLADVDADSDAACALRPLQAAAWPCRPRLASGQAPRQAQTVHWTVCVRARPTALPSAHAPGRRCLPCNAPCLWTLRATRSCVPTIRATAQHAAVRCDADERQRLEQLCRYVTRPALANEACRSTAPDRSCSNSRPPGAMAPPTS